MSLVRIRHFQSESFRLAAIYAGLFVGCMALLAALIYLIVAHAFEANLLQDSNDDLAAIHRAYTAELAKKPAKAIHEAQEMIEDRLLATDRADFFLLQRGGLRLSGNLPAMAPRTGVRRFPDPGARNGAIVFGRGEFIAPGLYAFVGRDLGAAKTAEAAVLRTFGWVILASLVMAFAGGLVLSQSFLRRIDAMTDTCRAIMAGRLSDRVPVAGARHELGRLATTINDMLDRIEALMESLRQVSNDIAHDLRTPLAHLRYGLERARDEARSPQDHAAAIDAAIADSDKLLAMFAALLRISQIEAGHRHAGIEKVALPGLLARAADLYRPVMDDGQHPFAVEPAADVSVRGDPQLLLQLLANLLDNAVHHTPPGTPVVLAAAMQGPRPAVIVSDGGPGIPAGDRGKVLRRFFRCEASRTTPGSGLGLALVSAIADLHDAEISLLDNDPGLRVVVTFPVAA